MRLTQVSCAPALHCIQWLCPQLCFCPLPCTRIDTHTAHEELVWGAETNCIKLKKKIFRSIQLVQISCHDLKSSSKKRKGGNIKLGSEGIEESEQLHSLCCIALHSHSLQGLHLHCFWGQRVFSIYQSPHTSAH